MTSHRLAVLIDGGHLRVLARQAKRRYTADFIEKVGLSCAGPTDLSDEDFDPVFEQKGGDMRIGLDIASSPKRGA